MMYLGIDQHARQLTILLRDERDDVIQARQVSTHLLFIPIFTGLRNVPLAALDILIVWATIIGCPFSVSRHYRWVAVAQVPYFVWVSLATMRQLSIMTMNWGKS